MDTAKKYDPWIYQGQSLKVFIHIMINTLSKFNPYQVKNDKQLPHFHIISFNNKHGQHVTNIKTDNDTCRQSLWPVRVINGCCFGDDIFKHIFLNANVWIFIIADK